MKNQEYWRKRFEQLEAAQINKGVEFYHNLSIQYDKAAANIRKEIEAFYQRFADNNKIDLFEAKKLLNSRQLKEFRWDVEEYIKKGETLDYSNEWAKALENASTRYRVTRLEAMKLQMQQQVEVLMGNEVDGLDRLIRDIYEDGYYRSIFEIQKGTGMAISFMRLNTDVINKVISKPWTADGTNFSKRIWGQHRPELVQTLNTDFVQSLIRGDDPQKLINKISKDFDVAKHKAGNVVMTESAFFAAEADKKSMLELGVEYFEISAALDLHTCDDCGYREGIKIPMSEFEPGVTAPPFHPRCRCTSVPYIDDEWKDENSTRFARDEHGKNIDVPADLTYKDWKEKFLTNGENSLQKIKNDDTIKPKDVSQLEQAKNRNKKIYINDIAISKVPLTNIQGLTDEQNVMIQQKHKNLLYKAMTENDSNEVANVFSLDLKHDIFQLGSEMIVPLSKHPTIADIIMHSADKTVFIAHNHPSTKKFSYSDLGVLLANNSVFGISVVANNGETYILYKTKKYYKENAIELLRDIKEKYIESNNLNWGRIVNDFLQKCSKVNLVYIKR